MNAAHSSARCGRTVKWWTSYRHQTGAWPWFSIVIHFMNWVVILIGGGFLIWWTVEHHLSRWQFFGVFLFVSLPYTILENWAKSKEKLIYLRKSRTCLLYSPLTAGRSLP